MFMKEIAENKAANYKAHQANEAKSKNELIAIKNSFHLRALIKSIAK